MKNMRKLLAIFLLLSLVIGCTTPKKSIYVIKMKLVDGTYVTNAFELPTNCSFNIMTHYGSYWLGYNTKGCFARECDGIVRNGVIDYEILHKE